MILEVNGLILNSYLAITVWLLFQNLIPPLYYKNFKKATFHEMILHWKKGKAWNQYYFTDFTIIIITNNGYFDKISVI